MLATTPENSCPGMMCRGRGSPFANVEVGAHWSSLGVTPAAWTRINTSPAPGLGRGASSYTSESGPEPCRRSAFIGLPSPSAEEHLRLGVARDVHRLQLARRLGEGHAHDVRTAQCHHLPPVALVDRVDRVQAEAGRQPPVERGRRAAALDVAEHRAARLLARPLLDLAGQPVPDARELDVAEGVA